MLIGNPDIPSSDLGRLMGPWGPKVTRTHMAGMPRSKFSPSLLLPPQPAANFESQLDPHEWSVMNTKLAKV